MKLFDDLTLNFSSFYLFLPHNRDKEILIILLFMF